LGEETLIGSDLGLDDVGHHTIFEVHLAFLEDLNFATLFGQLNGFVEVLILLVDNVHHLLGLEQQRINLWLSAHLFLVQYVLAHDLLIVDRLLGLHGGHHAISDSRLLEPKAIGMKLDLGLLKFRGNYQALLQSLHL